MLTHIHPMAHQTGLPVSGSTWACLFLRVPCFLGKKGDRKETHHFGATFKGRPKVPYFKTSLYPGLNKRTHETIPRSGVLACTRPFRDGSWECGQFSPSGKRSSRSSRTFFFSGGQNGFPPPQKKNKNTCGARLAIGGSTRFMKFGLGQCRSLFGHPGRNKSQLMLGVCPNKQHYLGQRESQKGQWCFWMTLWRLFFSSWFSP